MSAVVERLAEHPKALRWSEVRVTAAAWICVGLVATGLRALRQRLVGEQVDLSAASADVWLIAQWALVTPLVLRSAKRFPVRTSRVTRNAVIHLSIGTAFIVLSNILIRLPMLWQRSHGARALFDSTAGGLAIYYPTAIVLWSALVVIGHGIFARSVDPPRVDDAPSQAPEAMRLAPPAVEKEGPLVIREWNRVHFIALEDIEWIEADNNHVVVHTTSRTYKGRERMSDVEGRLNAREFVRVHRSAIVHRTKIREVQPLTRGDQAVILRSGRVVRVSRARRHALEHALGTEL